MREVDDVLLPRLKAAVPNEDSILDGYVVTENQGKVVTYPLPYTVYTSSIGADDNPRLSGRRGRLSVFFTLKHVGLDRNQVKAQGQLCRKVLAGKRILIPGYRSWLCQLESSTRVFKDEDAIRPDGTPLYYCVDDYAISITQTHGSTP